MKARFFIFAILFSGLEAFGTGGVFAAPKSCIDWPRVMAQYELDYMPAGKTVLALPFTNFTKVGNDDWMAGGIRDYLADLMKSGTNIRVLAGNTAAYGRQSSQIDYTVSGKFEHTPARLRVFVALNEGLNGALKKQFEVSVPYPDNKDFFTELAGTAGKIMETIGAKKDPAAFDRVRDETASTRAYESYSRGRQILETFSPVSAESSADFFNKAISEDWRSPLGYLGLVDLYSFMGFYHKQTGGLYTTYFQKAGEEISEMKRLAGRLENVTAFTRPKAAKKNRASQIANRFIAGDVAFREGLAAEKTGDYKKAANAFRRSVKAVPEDAVSWLELSRALTVKGDEKGSKEALQKAIGINSCIEN